MLYDKPFKTLDEQIALLRSRGLVIDNEDHAKHLLLTSSYYDLTNGYKNVFMPNDTFIKGTFIEDLFLFSYIDKNIQSLMMKYGLMVEVKFKTNLAYILAQNIGVHQDEYLNPKYYKQKANKGLPFSAVRKEISKQLNADKAHQPTKHYLENHNHVPPWILLKNVSLGTSINLFNCLSSKNKVCVANLLIPSQVISMKDKITLIITAMEGIRTFRNCAAHNLNFVKQRTTYNIPGKTLYALIPKGVIRQYRNELCLTDRKILKGLFGIIVSACVILNDKFICTCMLDEFSMYLTSPDKTLDTLFLNYRKVSDIPEDIVKRFSKLKNYL